MSTIEAITLEYSYLLSSQLEAMRQHYESLSGDQAEKLSAIRDLEARIESAEKNRIEADQAREKAEKRAEKAAGLTRSLQASLSAEKSMSEGMSARIHKLQEQMDKSEMERKERDDQIKSLEETVRDLMFSLEAGLKIQAAVAAVRSAQWQLVGTGAAAFSHRLRWSLLSLFASSRVPRQGDPPRRHVCHPCHIALTRALPHAAELIGNFEFACHYDFLTILAHCSV